MEVSTPGTNVGPKISPIGGQASDAAARAHAAVDKAASAAISTVQSVTPVIDKAAALGHQAVNKAEDTVKPAERWIHEKADALRAAPHNAASYARDYVVEHPWQSLGTALFVGLLVGRRMR